MLLTLRSFRMAQIVGGFLLMTALLLAVLVGLGGLASGASLAQMTPATAETLAQASPGATVLIEGRVSPQTLRPPNAPDPDMIIWTARLRLPGSGSEARWLSEDMVKQPLLIDLAAAQGLTSTHVRIANDDYSLAPLPQLIDEADYEVNGLSVGDNVVVVGELRSVEASGQAIVQARQVAFGTRDDLVRHMQGADWPYWVAAVALTAAGIATLLLDRLLLKPASLSRFSRSQ